MAYEFKLPDLGEGLTEGEISRWLVEEGQEVAEDDPLVEIQTDKTTVEIPSPAAGPGAGDRVELDAELLSDPPNEWRCLHLGAPTRL